MRKNRVNPEPATREFTKPDEQWRQELTPMQYSVPAAGPTTERPFTGEFVHNHKDGTYRCAGCGAELFPLRRQVRLRHRLAQLRRARGCRGGRAAVGQTACSCARTEVVCRPTGGHLGHVFNDGPTHPTGDRYCINSCSLAFEPADK